MQLTTVACVECHGKVKYSGLDTGNVPWKNGKLIIQLVNGTWRMNLEYDVCKGTPHKSYTLSPGVIKKLICKAQLVIELHPDGRGHSQQNLHLKPQFPHQIPEMNRFYEKLLEIQQLKDEPFKAKAEVGMSPSQSIFNSTSSTQYKQMSPDTFTSVKSKDSRKRLLEDDSDEEDFKENLSRSKISEKFLERGCEKSKNWLSTETSPIKFYGQKSPCNSTYASFGQKKGPGLMPEPARKRLTDVKYSWIKPKLTAPTDTNQQQNLHGFSNLGNTCYMNAILQSLVHLDTFTTDLLHGNKKMIRTLEPTSLYKCMELVFNSRIKNVPDFSKREYLKNLKQAISSSAKRFSGYQQHDAHEFLGQLLDQLKEEVTKISKSTPSPHRDDQNTENEATREYINPTVQNFEFEVTHRIKCEECGEEVTKEEQFNDLSIDMPRSRDLTHPRSLQDALEMSLRKESIEYTCEKCHCTRAVVTHKFTKLPRVLVLHLKRYSYNMLMSRQAKAGQNITIPRYLTLQSHCEEETRPPFPTIPPPEPKSLSIPDSPLREKNENTPRRRLDTNPSFRFKKIRTLPDFESDEDNSKTASQQTSTPNKKLTDEPDVITDRKLTLDDEFDDPELAKALELSLKEASDRAQGYYDEVDGMVEDTDLKKVLEMSRQETESGSLDHDYDKNLRTMTEEEQIELAMTRSLMEFDREILKECSSTVAEDLLTGQGMESNRTTGSIVQSKFVKSEKGNKINKHDVVNDNEKMDIEDNCSPMENCDDKSTFELTENSYFHLHSSDKNTKEFSSREVTDNRTSNSNYNNTNNKTFSKSSLVKVSRSNCESEASVDNEVMIISDNTDSEPELQMAVRTKSFDLTMEISDPETNEVKFESLKEISNLKTKSGNDVQFSNTRKGMMTTSKDIEGILLVDEMTSADVKHIRTVEQPKETPVDSDSGKSMDIVDLFCNEEDDLLINQWDKENYNPDNTTNHEEEELIPRIDNEKGELPYSYRLVSIVNHIGSSSIVGHYVSDVFDVKKSSCDLSHVSRTAETGHYVSDVFDIKKSSWFSCDDSRVSRTAETEVRAKRERTGYIFFYLNKDIFDDLKDHYALHTANKKEMVKK